MDIIVISYGFFLLGLITLCFHNNKNKKLLNVQAGRFKLCADTSKIKSNRKKHIIYHPLILHDKRTHRFWLFMMVFVLLFGTPMILYSAQIDGLWEKSNVPMHEIAKAHNNEIYLDQSLTTNFFMSIWIFPSIMIIQRQGFE